MPVYEWTVDDTAIKVHDLSGMLTVVDVGAQRIPLPVRTLGSWSLPVPDRDVRLEARRNIDVIRYVITSDGHEIPRSKAVRLAALPDTRCSPHNADAICRCSRCEAPACRACTPDSNHCTSCLLAISHENRLRVAKLRRRGLLASAVLVAVLILIGVLAHAPRIGSLGVATGGLVLWLWLHGAWRERVERKRGMQSAVDGPGVKVANAVVVRERDATRD